MSALGKLLAPLARRVNLMVARGVVTLVNDALKLQGLQVQLLADEVAGDVERFQNYAFTSVPLEGAEAAVVFVGGNRSHGLVIAVDDRRYRVKGMLPGESAQYNHLGDYIKVLNGRIIEVKAGTKLLVDAPLAEFTGNVTVAGNVAITGNLAVTGTMLNDGANVGKTHVHGGVQVGAANTAGPQ